MTTYRLFPSTNGPSAATGYTGNFLSAVAFAVAGGGKWFEGYWWWVCASGQLTSPVKCALWSAKTLDSGTLVPGSVVTSGTLVAGQWNYIPLAEPVQLAPSYDPNVPHNGSAYIAAVGCNGAFPDTNGFWGTGGPGVNGISSGPLFAYSGANGTGGTAWAPYSLPQGCFTTGGSDPSVTMPNGASGTDCFWVDVQVSDTAPAGYGGTYRLWPNKADANPTSSGDAAVDYLVAVEVEVTQPVTLDKIWYYSPPGSVQLATWAGVWTVTGPGSGAVAAVNASPSWSGAAGSGWISTPVSGVLAPGTYKVAVYNDAASPSSWSPKDASSAYFDLGAGANGITWGPLTAPDLAGSSPAYEFGTGSNTPATSTEVPHGQATFSMPVAGITMPYYPYLWAPVNADTDPGNAVHTQNYWVDVEVTSSVRVVQHVSGGHNGSTTLTLTLGSPTAPGNCLVAVIGQITSTTPPSVLTLGGSADNWHQDAINNSDPDGVCMTAWSDPSCAGGQTSIAVTATGSFGVDVWEVSGLAPVSPFDVAASAHSPPSTPQTAFDSGATVLTAQASEFWVASVAVFGESGHSTLAAAGSWTLQSQIAEGSHVDVLSGYQVVSSKGQAEYSGTIGGTAVNGLWGAITATYKAAGASPASPSGLLMAGIV